MVVPKKFDASHILMYTQMMIHVVISFIGEINDLLPHSQRGSPKMLTVEEHQTIKHLIESCGVPHTEVCQITANGSLVNFSYHPNNDDFLEVFPFTPIEREENLPPSQIRFVLDMHLGKLARDLRLLGFDCMYRNDFEDDELAEIASRELRILLTRDRRLLMRKQVQYGYCPRHLDPRQQLLEVLHCFNLQEKISPFQRCPHCNELLEGSEQGKRVGPARAAHDNVLSHISAVPQLPARLLGKAPTMSAYVPGSKLISNFPVTLILRIVKQKDLAAMQVEKLTILPLDINAT